MSPFSCSLCNTCFMCLKHLNGRIPVRKIIVMEIAFGDSVKMQGQEQCES